MNSPKAYISSIGMITAVGGNAEMTKAAINAGISMVGVVDFYDDFFEPVRMCTVPDEAIDSVVEGKTLIYPLTPRQYRMLQLSNIAISELSSHIPDGYQPPLFLAGPENIVDSEPSIDQVFIRNLASQSGLNIDLDQSRFVAIGRAGGLDVIETAISYFEQGLGHLTIVGGVDTFYDKDIVNYYVGQQRILSANISDGFIPGEAAGFLLLVSPNAPESLIENCRSIIMSSGSESEGDQFTSTETYTGDGLAKAMQMALVPEDCRDVSLIMSSMNGESFFAKELGVAITRNSKKFHENLDIDHIADKCGDLGAAVGPVMAGVLHGCGQIMANPGLIYCSSDSGHRSAICMKAVQL